MKKGARVVALCCLLVLVLCGCQAPRLPEQTRGESNRETSAVSKEPAPSPQATTVPANLGEGSLTEYIGLTYEQLTDAYGPSQIFHWYELGLYCHFEDLNITFLFDFEMIHPHYSDVSLWLDDPGEFTFGNGDPVYNFETGRYSPSDFKVVVISVWDDTLAQLLEELRIEAPATLRMLNKGFGEILVAEENLMTGLFEVGMYFRGDYMYSFSFDENGRYVTSARILSHADGDAGTYSARTVRVFCGTLELDKEIIWLLEPTDNDGMDMGGGFAYTLAPALVTLFRTDPPFIGELYYVKIDENSVVTQLDLVLPPSEDEVLYVLTQYEETAYLMQELGMAALAEMQMVFIEGNLCYTAILGTNHDGYFVRERYYAIDVEHGKVYEYDEASGSYTPLGMG